MTPTTPEQARLLAQAMTKSVWMMRLAIQTLGQQVDTMTEAISAFAGVLEDHANECKLCGDCDCFGEIIDTIPRRQVDEHGKAIGETTKPEAETATEEDCTHPWHQGHEPLRRRFEVCPKCEEQPRPTDAEKE